MRVESIQNAPFGVAFYGVQKPFTNKKGIKVIPINEAPSQSQIDSAIEATRDKSKKPMAGYNGEAFWLGEDLVVKKYKGENAFSDDPMREIDMLDTLYDHNLKFPNSQRGQYAFMTPNGEYYMVSTKVQGENPDFHKAPFTKENLKSLVGIITRMDKGAIFNDSSKNGYSDRCRFMNYDFNGGNIKVTQDSTGLFDFEYSVIENIDDMIEKTIIRKDTGANCHQSDTSGLPSSLRSFEFYTFCDYLKSADDRKTLFDDYIEIKGKYHNEMADFYESFADESSFKGVVKDISQKERVHARLLRKDTDGKIPFDIKKSEAIKIQMANFMHEQSQFSDTGIINPDELKQYTENSIRYFEKRLQMAQNSNNKDRTVYYKDCLELFESWKRVNKTLKEKIDRKDPEILRKLTSENILTLPEMLGL